MLVFEEFAILKGIMRMKMMLVLAFSLAFAVEGFEGFVEGILCRSLLHPRWLICLPIYRKDEFVKFIYNDVYVKLLL